MIGSCGNRPTKWMELFFWDGGSIYICGTFKANRGVSVYMKDERKTHVVFAPYACKYGDFVDVSVARL